MKKTGKIAFVAMMGLLLFGCSKKNNKDNTTKNDNTTITRSNVTTKSGTTTQVKKCILRYNANGGNISGTKIGEEVTFGKAFELLIPTKEGSTFKGWYYEKGTEMVFLTGADGKSIKAFDVEVQGETLNIYASWEDAVYSVLFDANYGDDSANFTQDVKFGQYASKPDEDPERDGYHFDGWFTKATGGEEWAFTSTQIRGETTIYAHWTAFEYAFAFESEDDGEISVTSTVNAGDVACGTSITLTATELWGATFTGWYSYFEQKVVSTDKEYTFNMPAHDDTFRAEFTSYTLWLKKDGEGTVSPGYYAYTAGEPVTIQAKPATGYTFVGWFDGETKVIDRTDCTKDNNGFYCYDYIMPFANAELTAKFSVNTHTITIDKDINRTTTEDYGTISQSHTDGIYEYGETVTLTATPATGYTFLYWYDVINDTYYNSTFNMVDEDLVLTGIFTYYTVGCDNECNRDTDDIYGSTSLYGEEKYSVGSEVTLTATPEEGYTFVGWWDLDANDWLDISGVDYTKNEISFAMPNTDVEVRAIFTYYLVQVSLRASDASFGQLSSDNYVDETMVVGGTQISVTATSKYPATVEFDGWYLDGIKTVTNSTLTFTVYADDFHYEARFKLIDFTITYTLNGGTNNSNNPTKVNMSNTFPITLANPTRDGYSFAGWKENGSTVTEITSCAAHTYVANWTAKNYNAHFILVENDNNTGVWGKYRFKTNTMSSYSTYVSTSDDKSAVVTYDADVVINLVPYLGRKVDVNKITVDGTAVNGTYNSSTNEFTFTYKYAASKNIYINFGTADNSLQYFNFVSTESTCEILSSNYSTVTEIYIPTYVTKIEKGAFRKLYKIEKIEAPFIGETKTAQADPSKNIFGHFFGYYGEDDYLSCLQFYDYNDTTYEYNCYLPKSLTTFILNADYTNSTATFNDYCFCFTTSSSYDTPNITTIGYWIGSNTSVGNYAFYNLKKLSIFGFTSHPEDESSNRCWFSVGHHAFQGTAITGIEILKNDSSDSLTIGDSAFRDCSKLTYVLIDENVIVGNYAFTYCTSLNYTSNVAKSGLIIKKGVRFKYEVFGSSTPLTAIRFTGTKSEWSTVTLESNWNNNSHILGYYYGFDTSTGSSTGYQSL
ncbi:MAG: InlB B-repeat-containing protein [Acholeplasmatales bacterium]|nr:InlB B-repeat-containing protein [Acholeplasmatales bacterium]